MSPLQQTPTPGQHQGSPPEPKYGFRWSVFVGIPLTIGAILFLLNGIEPSGHFEDVMRWLRVTNEDRYVKLVCLGVACVVAIVIVKSLRNHRQ